MAKGMARFSLAAILLLAASAAVGQSNGFNVQPDPIRPVRVYNSAGQVVDNFGGSGGSGGTVNQGTPGSTAWPVSLPNGQVVNVGNFPTTQAISGSVSVSNFPASQAVTGTFWQATQPVSLASAPLPSGAATAANQNVTAAGTSATSAQAVQGVAGGVPQNVAQQDGLIPAGSPFSIANLGVLYSIDTAGYASVAAQLTGTWSGTVTYEHSNDNTTWTAVPGNLASNTGTLPLTNADNNPGIRVFPTQARYFRARVTSYTSGTIVGVPVLRMASDSKATVYVGSGAIALNAGINSIGGIGATNLTGGVTGYSRIVSSAASTNATLAKGAAGRLYKIFACNTNTTPVYLRFYNLNVAPTVGTSAVVFSRPFPAASAAGGLACASYDMSDIGWFFSTGIAYAMTTGAADNDTTALTAGQIVQLSVEYQ